MIPFLCVRWDRLSTNILCTTRLPYIVEETKNADDVALVRGLEESDIALRSLSLVPPLLYVYSKVQKSKFRLICTGGRPDWYCQVFFFVRSYNTRNISIAAMIQLAVLLHFRPPQYRANRFLLGSPPSFVIAH